MVSVVYNTKMSLPFWQSIESKLNRRKENARGKNQVRKAFVLLEIRRCFGISQSESVAFQ